MCDDGIEKEGMSTLRMRYGHMENGDIENGGLWRRMKDAEMMVWGDM
jgi:hypothetical protein